MKLESFFIGAALFSLVFTLGLSVYAENLSNYGVSADDSKFGKVTIQLKSVYDETDDMVDRLQGEAVTDQDAVDEMVRGGYTSIRSNPFTVASIATNATMQIAKESGFIHGAVIKWLTTVLVILVVFAIIAIVFRFRAN